MEFNKPFSLPAVLGAESSTAEDENHGVWSLQFGELPTFRGLVGKLIVGEDCPGHNVRSHIQPPFLLEHDHRINLWVTVHRSASVYRDIFVPIPSFGMAVTAKNSQCVFR